MNGIEIAETFIQQGRKEHIVFISSSEEGKIEGYRVNALRYITKPINKNVLFFDLEALLEKTIQDNLFIYDEKIHNRKLFFKDIEYIEVIGRYTYVNIKGEIREFRKQLNEWEIVLEEMQFVKSHKSFLINLNMVSDFTKHYVILKSGKKLALTRTYYMSFKEAFSIMLEGN